MTRTLHDTDPRSYALDMVAEGLVSADDVRGASENIDWDDDAKKMVDWICEHHDNQEP